MAWKKAMALARVVYAVTANFPKNETFGLTAQMRRAAVSIPRNIMEGHARFSRKEFKHFLRNARGSLAELETQAILSKDLRYLNEEEAAELLKFTDELGRF
ncbi:MAG: four helix bundle protein [Terriglobales bacterium]